MARRSIKEYVKGLKKQVADEQAKLDEMRTSRDKELARMDAEIGAQSAKVEALNSVLTQMAPAQPPSRKPVKKGRAADGAAGSV